MSSTWRAPRSMGACLVWLASALPFLLEPFLAQGRLAGVSRGALAALPWIAWAGLPRELSSSAASSSGKTTSAKGAPQAATRLEGAHRLDAPFAGALLDVALCLPPIALGSWIDLASGIARADVMLMAGCGLVLVLLLSLSARFAQGSTVAMRTQALAWMIFVVGLPLLRGALELGGAPAFGAMPAWITWIARASPLAWIVARLDATASTLAAACGPLLVTLVLLSIGMGFARSATRRQAAA